ncbi:hypothetical protein BN946_scf185007.g165 [Trametes cinnabarina]|uniref:Uncharacterized protein n=1 Tax=Pycnoporus cinnabarinus TaxID=5643 RepID=A0A060SFW0_PYCCI|nr:hypothetical protein BN946_scf185007.g165 [Trametes cinnabarina]
MIRLSAPTTRQILTRYPQVIRTRTFAFSAVTNMPVSDPEAPNASGLSANETKGLKERIPEPHEERILQGIKELYTSQPTESTYEIYAPNAVFHDPIGIADGIKSIRAQFNGLAKLFPRADIPSFRLLENPPSVPKSKILIDQDVDYYRDPKASSPTKTVNSLLTLETNDQHQIVKHTEEWNHLRETTGEDGFVGMLNEHRKKFTANFTGMFISQEPPAQKKD